MQRVAPARNTHLHAGCQHYDLCYTPRTTTCRRCQTKAFNDLVAQQYHEDSMTVTELLERRA